MNKLTARIFYTILFIIIVSLFVTKCTAQTNPVACVNNYNSVSGIYAGGEFGLATGRHNITGFYLKNFINKDLYGLNYAFIINKNCPTFNLAIGCKAGLYDNRFGVLMPYIDQRFYLNNQFRLCLGITAEKAIVAADIKLMYNFKKRAKKIKVRSSDVPSYTPSKQ